MPAAPPPPPAAAAAAAEGSTIAAAPAPSPWRWVPTLYVAQGLPYVAVMTLSVVLYKNLGVSNAEIAWATSWLNLPWVLKPLWGPVVELLGTRRRWIVALQFAVGAALACFVLVLPGPHAVRATLALFWLLAFASATHDIAADGFYLLALPQRQQAAFVGVRSTAWRLAMLGGQGGLVVLAGWLQQRGVSVAGAWATVFALLAAIFFAGGAWHARVLPRPAGDVAPARGALARDASGRGASGRGASGRDAPTGGAPAHGVHAHGAPADAGAMAPGSARASDRVSAGAFAADFARVFAAFFRQPGIARILAFLLLYRFAEAQLLKLVVPFLLDPREAGGLGLSTQAVGVVYGTVGVAALTAGGLLGGWVISRRGLRATLWPLMLCMHVPNLLFVALAAWQPTGLALVGAVVAVEQFGYGFGFTAYMVFLLLVAGGADGSAPHKTAHYAIGTGFMALGMMVPGLWAGWLQQALGYRDFFVWTCVATLASFAAAAFVRIDPAFGRRDDR